MKAYRISAAQLIDLIQSSRTNSTVDRSSSRDEPPIDHKSTSRTSSALLPPLLLLLLALLPHLSSAKRMLTRVRVIACASRPSVCLYSPLAPLLAEKKVVDTKDPKPNGADDDDDDDGDKRPNEEAEKQLRKQQIDSDNDDRQVVDDGKKENKGECRRHGAGGWPRPCRN